MTTCFPGGTVIKNLPASAGETSSVGSITGLGRTPGEGNGNLLHCSCLGNSIDRGSWRVQSHGVTKSGTWLSMCTHAHNTHNTHRSTMDQRLNTWTHTHNPTVDQRDWTHEHTHIQPYCGSETGRGNTHIHNPTVDQRPTEGTHTHTTLLWIRDQRREHTHTQPYCGSKRPKVPHSLFYN